MTQSEGRDLFRSFSIRYATIAIEVWVNLHTSPKSTEPERRVAVLASAAGESGQKGVSQEQVGSGKEHDPNNFANDPERARAAGRKGGHESHKRD